MPSSEFLLGKSQEAFDYAGKLKDAEKVAELDEVFREFLLFTKITLELLAEKTALKKDKKFTWEV